MSTILIVDPDEDAANAVAKVARGAGLDVECVANGPAGLERGLNGDFEAVVTELRLDDLDGVQLISHLHAKKPRLPIIMLTGHGTSRTAIEAIKSGAFDYLAKPAGGEEIHDVLSGALEAGRRMSKPVAIGQIEEGGDMLIGQSRAMTEVYKELGRVSATPVTVLIRGETGTGKELIARAIYQYGHRAHQPFIAVNCAAIPENLLESELFGHEKGAFTGADTARIGRFEQAHNATLFLDEIGDLSLALQAKLLRVLQDKQIQRVGGREDIPVDARIIAATHRDLEKMMADGEFREDLFYRLNVASIRIPPLRKRPEDIPLLVEYFIGRVAEEYGLAPIAIDETASRFLQEQPWPGNVRQLQNVIRKSVLRSRGYGINRDDLRAILADSEQPKGVGGGDGLQQIVTECLRRAMDGESSGAHAEFIGRVERDLLAEAIRLADGNQAKAARWLGITRFTLREKLRAYGLHPVAKNS